MSVGPLAGAMDCGESAEELGESATYYGYLRAGWLKIGRLGEAIEHIAFLSHVEVNVVMHTGLFSRAAEFEVRGTSKNIETFKTLMDTFTEENQ